MTSDIAANDAVPTDAAKITRQVVRWAAILSTFLGALYLIGLVGKLIVDGSVHSVSSQPVQVISAITGILWDISLLVLFVALRRQALGKNAVFADLAVVFMALVCATSSVSWFTQLAVLPKAAEAALIDIHNERSVIYAIEHLGWGIFYGLAVIFLALSMGNGKLESWIRWLFIAGGILSLVHVFGIVTSNPTIGDLGYLAWGVLLPITTILLTIQSATNNTPGS